MTNADQKLLRKYAKRFGVSLKSVKQSWNKTPHNGRPHVRKMLLTAMERGSQKV